MGESQRTDPTRLDLLLVAELFETRERVVQPVGPEVLPVENLPVHYPTHEQDLDLDVASLGVRSRADNVGDEPLDIDRADTSHAVANIRHDVGQPDQVVQQRIRSGEGAERSRAMVDDCQLVT